MGCQRRAGVVGHANGQGACRTGGLQGPQHIGGGARGGQQKHDVLGADLDRNQIFCPLGCVVLSALDGLEHGALAAGQQRLRPPMRPGEGRVKLHTVEHAQAARGARAGIQQTPTCLNARQRGIDGARQIECGGAYGLHRQQLVVHEGRHQVCAGIQVEVGVLRAGAFGGEHG